ncbi:hypothetical protein HYV21_02695 [Candidatus Microgenomates bacterium]|nr:hypothetical protein [Candidatus Microgenomates bacterium]
MYNLPKIWKVLLSITLIFLILFLFSTSPSYATPPTPTLGDLQKAITGDKYNKESFDFQSLTGVMGGATTMLLGCVIDTNGDGKIDYEACPPSFSTGALPTMGVAIAGMITNPPASGFNYLADIGGRLHIVKPAYAQQAGFGFGAIEPFLRAWRAVRNLAYLLFVLAAIGFGFAIMLRTRISPQAVITVQSALPRIIIALILITFSYAIVGFLIDIIYVGFGILVFGLTSLGLQGIYDPVARYQEYSTAGFGQTAGFIFSKGLTGGWDLLKGAAGAAPVLSAATGGIIGGAIALLIAIVPGAALGGVAVGLLPILLGLILAIIFFFFRVLFALARAYLLLLLHLILAPLFILWGIVGGGGIWSGWLRGLTANLLVFPVVGTVIWLTYLLITLVDQASGTLWAPPYIGGGADIIKGMIALGAVMLLPSIPDFINQILGVRAGVPLQLPQVQAQLQQALGNLAQLVQRARQAGAGG